MKLEIKKLTPMKHQLLYLAFLWSPSRYVSSAAFVALRSSPCQSITQSPKRQCHRPDDDFARLIVEFERHKGVGEERARPAVGPLSHLSDEGRDHFRRRTARQKILLAELLLFAKYFQNFSIQPFTKESFQNIIKILLININFSSSH